MSEGLLLEYVHILTRGQRMQELLADQVAARISDPERFLELDVLRSGAWAGAANAEVDASRLARALSVSEAELSRALQRLIQEHLIYLGQAIYVALGQATAGAGIIAGLGMPFIVMSIDGILPVTASSDSLNCAKVR